MRFAVALLLSALVSVSAQPVSADEPNQRDLLEAVERQLKAAREKVGPAVACIVVSRSEGYSSPEKPTPHPGALGRFDPEDYLKTHPGMAEAARRLDLRDPASIPDHGYAGGMVIDPAGLVLANYHSIDGATKIYVHLPGGKGSYADIHAADARSDLAVLKLLDPPPGLKAVNLCETCLQNTLDGRQANVTPGKLVVVMANSYAANFAPGRASSALGTISNIRRRPAPAEPSSDFSRSIYNYSPILEYEARLNMATSGAVVLNLDGEAIGITTITAGIGSPESGTGQALPFERNLRRIIDVLRRGEEVDYGFLGVILDKSPGITLGQITSRGPASDAGLLPGDRIVAIDGHRANSYGDLLLYLSSALAGTKLHLQVESGGDLRKVEVTLAKLKKDTAFVASVRPEPVFGLRVDYSSVLAQVLNDVGRQGNGVPHGVVIRELEPGSPAAARFKELGENSNWVITHVNGIATRTPPEFYKAARGKASVKLSILDPAEAGARPIEVTLP